MKYTVKQSGADTIQAIINRNMRKYSLLYIFCSEILIIQKDKMLLYIERTEKIQKYMY